MIFPVIINRRDNNEQLRKDVAKIKANMPKKSAYQVKMESLQDACVKYESALKAYEKKLESVLSLNEELIRYIENIEEIKESGGISISVEPYRDYSMPSCIQVKMITIPEVKIAVMMEV